MENDQLNELATVSFDYEVAALGNCLNRLIIICVR